ncbi:hypothetical protein GUITHDRAFT_118689 [Guillardia theta CCMP2712]|uniref:RWP-RK domain-containing protein n=1 Tax=Guillardia theta (strain CCMP2712) TaxID=905079 RepID=L1IGB9_GUITC|nr:hypothetical protein GUITHDRAFT_118689 [Guillardia theta CCMP2712]EKX35142.1 hypothetical protein GUITHDRAFT_118689 [Guillardia theta CCMP2712]|eukprot:XP_005822122.1 hypothetical protein GUITHDRAFT_118689 [Guillardia theta CCMP2712]
MTKQPQLQIFPRRKAGQSKRDHGSNTAVVLSLEILQSFSEVPLVQAAKKLGISKTALKSACRTLGLERWPFRKPNDPQGPGDSLQTSDINMLNHGKQDNSNSEVDSQFSTSECTKGSETTASQRSGEDDYQSSEDQNSDSNDLSWMSENPLGTMQNIMCLNSLDDASKLSQPFAINQSVEQSSGQSSGEDDLDSYNSSNKQSPEEEDEYPLHVRGDFVFPGPCRFSKKVCLRMAKGRDDAVHQDGRLEFSSFNGSFVSCFNQQLSIPNFNFADDFWY